MSFLDSKKQAWYSATWGPHTNIYAREDGTEVEVTLVCDLGTSKPKIPDIEDRGIVVRWVRPGQQRASQLSHGLVNSEFDLSDAVKKVISGINPEDYKKKPNT